MANNDFQILLQALLDEASSKTNIDKNIDSLQKKINSIKIKAELDSNLIRNLSKQILQATNTKTFNQSSVSKQIFNTNDLDKQGRLYIQKVSNTINKTKSEINCVLKGAGYTDIKITGIEKANGQIKSITVNATDAAGALKSLNFEREKLQKQGKAQGGLVQTNEVKILGNLNTLINEQKNKLSSVTEKWQKQGILVGDFKQKVIALATELSEVSSKGDMAIFKNNLKSVQAEADKTIKELNSLNNFKVTQLPTITANVSDGFYKDQVQQQIEKYERLGIVLPNIQNKITQLGSAEEHLSKTINSNIASVKAKQRAFEEYSNALKMSNSALSIANSMYMSGDAVDGLVIKLQTFLQKNTAMTAAAKTQIQGLIISLQNTGTVTKSMGNNAVITMKKIEAEQRTMGKLGDSLFTSLKKSMQPFAYFTSATYIMMRCIRAIKTMVGNVHELDDALTNISYTMDVSSSQLERIGESSLEMAKDLNTSASNVLSAVKLYANAKETAETILQKSQPALMISNVTGMTGEESAKMLQAIMNQFDMTQDDLMEIADTIEMVSQNMAYDFASGIDEIAKGIEQSGSVAKSAGLNLQEYVSMLGLVIEKTGQSGSTVGNAYKTIFQRITKASATEGTLEEDISAAEKSLRSVGIEVRDTADEFRDLTDIMADLGKVWDSLSSVEQSNISYNVAGIRQTNILKSLLGYWEDYESLVEKANNAGGTALQNQEIYAESLTGKLSELSAIWENIGHDTLDSSWLEGFTDVGTAVSSLIEKLGLLNTILVGTGITAFVKNFAQLKSAGESLAAFNIIQNTMGNTSNPARQFALLQGSLKGYSAESVKAAIAQTQLTESQIKTVLASKGLEGEVLKTTSAELAQTTTTKALTVSQEAAATSTTKFKFAMKGLGKAIKAHPVLLTAAAVGTLIFAIDKFTTSEKEAQEAMEESSSELDSQISKLEELEDELKTCTDRINELQKKANAGTISIVEQDELDKLKEENFELERNIELQKKKMLAQAEQTTEDTTVDYKKKKIRIPIEGSDKTKDVSSGEAILQYSVQSEIAVKSVKSLEEELTKLQEQASDNNEASVIAWLPSDLKKIENTKEKIENIQSQLQKTKEKQKELSQQIIDIYLDNGLDEIKKNYDKVIEAGGSLTKEQQKIYDSVSAAENVFFYHNYLLEKTEENYKNLTEQQQRYIISQRLIQQGISQDAASSAVNGFTSEEMEKLYSADFSNFNKFLKEEKEKFEENADYTGDYVENAVLRLIGDIKGEISDINNLFSFEEVFNSEDFAEAKEKLLDLAKSGEITAEVLESTDDYKELLRETGLSAENAKDKILDLLSVQEKLSGAAQGFDSLISAYKEFKDEDIGFVTAQTLESLPDAFKNLDGFDMFSQIVGDPTSGTEQIQNAFNEIATQYLMSQDTLNGLIDASEHDIQSYIANLKQMGVTNAEEVVNSTLKVIKQEKDLTNAANKDYYEAYVKYLKSKDKADLEYVQSIANKNSQLAGALGKPYQTDYDNWCELLRKKAEAYNDFVTSLGGSLDKIPVADAPYSEEGLRQAKAEAIIKNTAGKDLSSWDELLLNKKGMIGTVKNFGNLAGYTKEQVEAAEKYLEATKIATEYKDSLKLDLSLIDTDFRSTFSPDVFDFSAKDTKETIDWIEIKIERLTELLDKLKTKADNTYASWTSRNTALAQAIDKTYEAINLQSQAYSRYMQEADSVGLSGHYKALVQNGAIDISTISDETLKDQINEYQNWYEKAQDCLKTQEDLNAELNEFKTQKFNHLKAECEEVIERMQSAYDLVKGQITLLSSGSDYNNLRGKQSSIISKLQSERNILQNSLNNSGIQMYTEEWYNLISQIDDLDQKISDANDSLKEIDTLQFDNIKEAFDFDISILEHGIDMIQNKLDLLEIKGHFANESYYNGMTMYTQKQLDTLTKERGQLQSILNNTLYKQGTSEWNDMYSTLMDIDEEIASMTNNLTEFNNAIRDLNWEIFEYLEESLNRITDETDYLIELLAKERLYRKDNGNMTEYADASIGLHATAYDVYKQQAKDYYEEVQDLQKQLVNGAGKDVLEQYNQMVDAHQDAVLAAEKEKKEQMQMEKSLYDYQKSIQEKTENIASLEKQKAAYADDDSEDAMSRIQKIKVQLEEAKADLEETEYERYLQDTENMLDQLASDYETWMNERLDNSDALLDEIVGTVSVKGEEINATLNEVAEKYGTMISDTITSVFDSASPFTTSLTQGLLGVNNSLQNGLNNVSVSIAGTTAAIDKLVAQVANLVNVNAAKTNAGSTNIKNTTENTSGGSGSSSGTGGSNGTSSNSSGNSGSHSGTSGSSSGNSYRPSTNTSSNTSSNGNSNLAGNIFIHKADSYPKNTLQKETSVVDRLKYNNFDSSFTARSSYYSKLGGTGTYTGSSSQNTWMIRKMKEMGYQKGTSHAKEGWHWTQENGGEIVVRKSDGAMLVPLGEGDMVFNNESTRRLYELSQNPETYFKKYNVSPDAIKATPVFEFKMPEMDSSAGNVNTSYTNSPSVNVGDVNITCNEVQNAKQLLDEVVNGLIQSSRFENAMFASINHALTGKGTSLDKLRYVKH